MKIAVKDRAAFAASVTPLPSLPVEKIVVAHDQIIDIEAKAKLSDAMQWLSCY